MKTRIALFSLLLIFHGSAANAQSKEGHNAISAGINVPLGNFSTTHSLGIDVSYSPARHKFGLVKSKHLALTWTGGAAYYFGKKEKVVIYPYRYSGYTFIYGFAGVLFHPVKKLDIIFYAGPGLGIYHGKLRFTIGSKFEINYFINSKFGISPGIGLMKENGADALWAVSLKGIIVF